MDFELEMGFLWNYKIWRYFLRKKIFREGRNSPGMMSKNCLIFWLKITYSVFKILVSKQETSCEKNFRSFSQKAEYKWFERDSLFNPSILLWLNADNSWTSYKMGILRSPESLLRFFIEKWLFILRQKTTT